MQSLTGIHDNSNSLIINFNNLQFSELSIHTFVTEMKKKNHPIFENIEITAAAAEGKAIARVATRVIFIGNAIPGDVADIQITKKQKIL